MKRIILILLVLSLVLSAVIIYLNNVILPKKVKSFIITAIEEQTQKKASLESVSINIFKGLVLRNLVIYDEKETFIKVKESSCTVLFLPVFKKKIIVPTLWLKSPVVSLVRRQDNTFNIQDLFAKRKENKAESNFNIIIYWVKVSNGTIRFQDNTLPRPFAKTIENLQLSAHLSFPASVKFGLKSQIPSATPITIKAAGEFKFPTQELIAKVFLQDVAPKDFSSYYQNLNISIPTGLINALANLRFAGGVIFGDLEAQNKDLVILKGKVSYKLNSSLKANLQYSLKEQRFSFSGKAQVAGSNISGLDFVGPINEINGDLTFNNSGIFSDDLRANIWNLPVQATASLTNFDDALLNIRLSSGLSLGTIQRLLREKLKFTLPGELKGPSNLNVGIQTKFGPTEKPQIHGWLDIAGGSFKLQKFPSPLEGIRGRLEFENSQLRWLELGFRYQGAPYSSKCVITDFKSPGVQFVLSSKDLSLDSVFALNNKIVTLTKLDGRYLNSEFSVLGKIEAQNQDSPQADLNGSLDINLEDASKPLLKNIIYWIENLKPSGRLQGQFRLYGDITNLKGCSIDAKFAGSQINIYGLKAEEFFLNYSQEDGKANFPLMHMSLYGGTLDASASMDFDSKDRPYWLNLGIKDVQIEKLKLDTPVKDKDVSGTVQAQVTINGIYKDFSGISGGGKIHIKEGKLWHLNLFKGLGALLFTRDFTKIIFSEGQCSFIIKDKIISTDKLTLRSDIVDLVGPVKIGFDKTISASLNVEVFDEMVPLSGTFRDVTTALVGQAGRFGVIELSGSINEPKYKFRTAVKDIIKGIKNAILH